MRRKPKHLHLLGAAVAAHSSVGESQARKGNAKRSTGRLWASEKKVSLIYSTFWDTGLHLGL